MLTINEILLRKQTILSENRRLHQRDLAHKLGISEVELLTLRPNDTVVRLTGDFKELLQEMKDLGYIMALTRNEACVHERKGVYNNIQFYDGPANMGVAVNPDIDLRFFMNEWVYGLAVIMERKKLATLHSFQFFNAAGEAVHKIFSTKDSDLKVYHTLVEEFKAEDQSPLYPLVPKVDKEIVPEIPDDEVDIIRFQQEWLALKDTHDFFGLLRKYNLRRTQAFRLAPANHSSKVTKSHLDKVLATCVENETPIMCFVHSKGCIQIHTGEIKNLKEMGSWFNVLDPAFNLHLNMDAVAETWIVRKPTADGIVTSLELFDQNGELIVYFFGARKPGKPELKGWRTAIHQFSLSS